jgi:hypothetical protein
MNDQMRAAEAQLQRSLQTHDLTAGMYVRVRGDHLIAGRQEPTGPAGAIEDNDRVRFTRLHPGCYGVSVKRHTGRWEKTPFHGSMQDAVDAVCAFMQHLVAPY